jgi:quinohemoprotein ethanol dehydrogenase
MQIGIRFARGEPRTGDVAVGGLNIGSVMADPQDGKGALLAWDPVRQKAAWRVQHDTLSNGGTLATAGDLVFQGTADGWFTAYDATDGRQLWRYDAGLGIIAAPVTFAAGGRQYVAVLVGYGGSAAMGSDHMNVGWKWGAQPRRLLVFALDGQAKLPPSPARDMTVHAVDDPKLQFGAADVAAGHTLYMACALCHGRDLVAVGSAPDLRESQAALDPEAFYAIVHDGALLQKGMPRFDMLSREQVRQVWSYIRAGARQAAAAQAGDKAPAKVQRPG